MTDVETAGRVFPLVTTWLDGLRLAPFSAGDLSDLSGLGLEDPNVNWQRELKPRKYYAEVLAFRLKHYRYYKFGVHGVWRDGRLIGQFGLQVLDVAKDQVEYVIFLAAQETGRGTGTHLLQMLLARAGAMGMERLYSVIRDENPSAQRWAQRLGARRVDDKLHYGLPAVVYVHDLER